MKLRNKKTGEITINYDLVSIQGIDMDKGIDRIRLQTEDGKNYVYSSLEDFNADWEDYEEPKELYIVDGRQSSYSGILKREVDADWYDHMIELGLGFRALEEVEQAVKKLKALKRLRDKGFKFTDFSEGKIEFKLDEEYSEFTYNGYDEGGEWYTNSEVDNDLNTLFGREE